MADSKQAVRQVRVNLGITTVWAHLMPLTISALLLILCFPWPGWGWLAHIALVPAAVVAMRAAYAKRLLWCGMVVFGAWWLFMLRWLIPVTVPGYVALALLMALTWALALLALRALHRRYAMPAMLALPLAWVSFELLRSYFPAGGFGWFMLGHTQASYAPGHGAGRLVQIADLFGAHALSFLVLMTSGLIIDLLSRPLVRRNAAGQRRPGRNVTIGGSAWLLAMIGAIAYGQYRINQFDEVTRPGPRIAVVQTNVPQDNKDETKFEYPASWWDQIRQSTRDVVASEQKPALVVWPETMVPGALNRAARQRLRAPIAQRGRVYHRDLQALLREINQGEPDTALLIGANAVTPTGDWHNSVYLYHADGAPDRKRYDKVYLVPFGEYIPWIDTIPGLKDFFIQYLTPYEGDYTLDPGRAFDVFHLTYGDDSELTFTTPICFEDTVARACRAMVYGGGDGKRVDALINVTNDGWFAGDAMRAQHVQIASLRTIENRVPMARSVNTGISALIDSVGRVGPTIDADTTGHAAATLRIDPRRTLYGRIGEWPMIALALVTAALILGGRWRRDKIAAPKTADGSPERASKK